MTSKSNSHIYQRKPDHWRKGAIKDTEKITLPPIQHVEPKSDIVKIDLALNPVHSFETDEPTNHIIENQDQKHVNKAG